MSDNSSHPGLGATTPWLQTQVKDLVENQQVIQVNSDATIEEACETLIKHNIQSVPLYDAKTQSYVGMFDLHDLATYILVKRSSNTDMDEISPADCSDLARNALTLGKKKFGARTTESDDVVVSRIADMSQINPFYSVLPETTLAQVVAVFAKGTHRVAVMDGTGKIQGILSQTRVIRHFFEHGDSDALDRPLKDLGLVTGDVVTVRPDTVVMHALSLLEHWRISSLAIVDEDRRIVGNLSVADVKYVARDRRLARATCIELVQTARFVQGLHDGRDRAAVFSVRPDASLRYALTKLIATGAHRVWVTEPRQSSTPTAPGAPPPDSTTGTPLAPRMRSGSISSASGPPPGTSMRRASVSSTSAQTVPIAPQHYGGSFNDCVCGVVSLTDILRLLAESLLPKANADPEYNYGSMD
ncbi:cell separation during budding [Coemansia sp. RSA 2322]|uniref:Cell separation during budding n=1 Tax=Coemansia thaxteri TaxID=2663907 RepID=A0A9W8BB09_9FUNG|nr:cell separation during budding [Coemansia thaxteri]KAJ2471407.1 cell separation during budding [Coemansia sp. RSA 2322]KAJ2484371.1 cell separation during budding [Coemansia sp. RSA 2320]